MTVWRVFAPYLAFVSPTPACGKTTSFKLLARLTPRAMIASNISGPAIPRLVEAHKPTLLVGPSWIRWARTKGRISATF